MNIGFIISTASFLVPRVVAAVKAVQGFVTVVETEKDALAAILDAGTDVFQALGNPEHVTLAVRHQQGEAPARRRRREGTARRRARGRRLSYGRRRQHDLYRLGRSATRTGHDLETSAASDSVVSCGSGNPSERVE